MHILAIGGGKVQPFVGQDVILGHAGSRCIQFTERMLRFTITRFGTRKQLVEMCNTG